MSELNTPAPSQNAVDALLNPEVLSGRQIEALKRIDQKNVDRADLAEVLQGMIDSYMAAKNSDG